MMNTVDEQRESFVLGLIRLVFPNITATKKETSSHLFKGHMFMTAASVYM